MRGFVCTSALDRNIYRDYQLRSLQSLKSHDYNKEMMLKPLYITAIITTRTHTSFLKQMF